MTREGDNPNTLVDAIGGKSKRVSLIESGSGNQIGVQYPLPTDGDSVYCKDILEESSSLNGFSGDICDLFTGLHAVLTDATATNPKEILIHFNRTIPTTVMALGAHSGNFSNIKISALISGHVEETLIDESSNNTDYTSRQFDLPAVGFNALRIQFHTTDAVSVSNFFIAKSRSVVSRIQGEKPDGSFVEFQATTAGNFKTSIEEFESQVSVNNNEQLKVTVFDVAGNETTRGYTAYNYLSTLILDGSADNMNVDGSSTPVEYKYTVPVGKKVKLTRGFITIEDGSTEFDPAKFGQITALSNGVEVIITPNGGSPIVLETWVNNRQIRNTMFDFDNQFKTAGAYIGRWTFSKDLSNGGFSLSAGDEFTIKIRDNLTALTYLGFRVKGTIEDV